MNTVAFLQNQWFNRPDVVHKVYAEHPDRREWLNAAYLFMGCKTGNMLRKAFGDECDHIIWENVSPEIGRKASASFPPDPAHVTAVIAKHRPGVVLLFGKIAAQVEPLIPDSATVIIGPHPAAREADVLTRLKAMEQQLFLIRCSNLAIC